MADRLAILGVDKVAGKEGLPSSDDSKVNQEVDSAASKFT